METEKYLSNYCDVQRAANIMKFFNKIKNINKTDYTKFALEEAIRKLPPVEKLILMQCIANFKSFLGSMAFDKSIKKLKDAFKICILTNGSVTCQGPKLEQCKAEKYFDAIVISGEINRLKPDPKTFHYACKKISLENNLCIMVGDNL